MKRFQFPDPDGSDATLRRYYIELHRFACRRLRVFYVTVTCYLTDGAARLSRARFVFKVTCKEGPAEGEQNICFRGVVAVADKYALKSKR